MANILKGRIFFYPPSSLRGILAWQGESFFRYGVIICFSVGFLAEGLKLVEFFSCGDETAFDAAFVGGQAVKDFAV